MSEKNFWEDAPIAEPAKKPEPNFWEQASIADVVAPVVPQPLAPPVETPVPNAVDRAVLRQPILPLLTGQKQPPLGKPSVRPARLGDTVVKPAFDFTEGKTGAVNDAFTRAWTGETQADLIGDLSSNMAEQARILSDPDYASKGPGIFNPGQQRNSGAAYSGMGGVNWTVPVVTASPSERLAVLQASRKNIIAKLRETKAILDNAQGSTQGMEDFKKAEGGWDTAGTLALNLFPIIAQGAAESSVVSAKAAVAGAATAALAGLTGGSSLVVQGAGLLGGALMTGMESYDSKLMESLIEYGNKTGVDILSDPEGWYKAAMKDPKNFEKVYNETNIQAARVGLTEGAATGVLGGLNKFIPGGEKLVSKLLIGAAKGAGEEMGTLFATNTVEGKENTLKDYALAGTLGATLDAGGDAFTTGVGKLFTGSTPAAAPAPAPPPPAPAAPAPAPLVPGAGVVPPVAAPVAPAAGPVAPVEAAPVQPVADLKQMEVDVGLARDAEEQAAKRLEAVAGQEFPDEQLLARMQAELADASATFQATELAFKQEQERQLAPQPVAPRQPAPAAQSAPVAPAVPVVATPAPAPAPAAQQPAPVKSASSFTAGLREEAAKLRGQRPAVPPTPAATATIPPAAPVATANVPPVPPVAAAANEPVAPATPPRTAAAPSPQPTPAPGANRASFDPQADPRWENLYRDQQKKIRELTAERDNVSQRRDRESRQGRSTKQSEKRLNTINTQIEEVLAQSQPRPEPVARPARQPAAPAAPVAGVPVDEPAAPVEPEGIVKAKAEAADIKDQLDKLEASGQGRTPQATKLRNRFNERKQDITRYENKNKLPLTYPPQARAGVASASAADSGPVWADIDMDNEDFAYDDALFGSRLASRNNGAKIEWDTSLNSLVAGLDSVENYRQNQRQKAAAEKQLKRLIAIAEKRFPGIVDLVTSEGYKPNDTDTKAEILAEPHLLANRMLREVNKDRFRLKPGTEANAQTDTQSERAAEPVAQDEPVTQAEPVANDQPAEPVAPVATEAKPDPAAEEDGPMPSDAEIEQELARIENDKAAQEQEARDAQAEEPAHVATFREAYDNLRDDLEGAAQEQSTADKQVNGKNGIITKADVLLEGAADMDPKEFARQARDIADKAESFAEDQQEKSDNIENAGREDTFDGRGSMIDGLNDLATNLREAADLADPKATTESTPAATVNPQLARIDKQLDTGTITREEHAELKQKIMGEPAAQAATSETVETPPDIADVAANDPKQTAQLELWADKTLRQARKNFNSGIDPTVLLAAAFKVAYMSARGIKKVTDITAALVKEYGEPIRQHIKDIIAKAKDPKLKAEVLDIIEAERPTGPLTPKQAEAARRSFKPVKLSVYEFGYKSNGKDKTVNAYGATMKEARSRAIASVASKLEIPASSVRLKGGKIVGNFEGFAVKPGVFDLDELPQVTKAPTTRLGWRKLFNAAGRAAAHAFSREDKGVATEGWQESLAIVKHGSSSGIIPPAPLQLHEWIKDPSSFRRFVEDAAKKNPQLIKSALEGLASLKDAHEAAARGAIPPEMVASHMAWGLLSRMLDPYNQEAGWIRLFNNEAVVNAIVDSVNGEFKMTKDEWKALVKSSMEKAEGETPAGRGATSNANAFHAMLEKWNGRWTELADIVNKSGGNVIKMRQAFFEQGFSGAGIKHKVLSFTLATLATMKPVVLDRWQVVNYWMPHLIEAARNMPLEDGSTDVFTFDKNGVPEDRTKAYALIGGLLNDNAVAEASYQIIENALLHIAEQNKEWLNPMFGLGPNEVVEPFKMHWLTWNIGKNEPVGHSSLDSTTFALKNNLYGKPDFAKRFAELNKKTERYTPQGDFEVFSASSDQRPTVSRRAAETDAGEASFSQQKDEGGGQDGPVRSGVTTPNQYTPEQRQLIQNIKDAVAAGADEKTILGHIDAWAKSTLPPGRLLSFGPQEFAALAWQTGRTSIAALGSFAQWSKQMVQTYGPKVKSFLKQIWIDSKAIRQNAFDFATVRYLASRADKIWQNADRNPQSPTLRKLANLLHTKDGTEATGELSSIPQRIREERIKFANAFARISEQFASEFLKMDKAARQQWDEDFRDYVLGNKKPTDPKVAKAVAEYRQLMGELLAFQRDAGIEMGDQGGNYFPRVDSPEAVEADTPGFIAAASEQYRMRDARLGNPTKTDAEYEALASARAFRILNGNVDQVQLNSAAVPEQSEMPSSTKAREFTDEEAELTSKFRSKDIERITLSYIGRATKAAEIARAFGPKGEKFTFMIDKLQKEGVDMETITETAGLVRRTLGYGIERHSKFAASVIDWSNAVVAAGFLGFSFINNVILEPVSYGVRTGNPLLGLRAVAETWVGAVRALSRPSEGMNARIEKAFGTRIGMAESFNEAMAEQLGLLQREMEHSFMDAHWNYMEEKGSPAARWVIQRVQKANLMQQTEHAKVAASVGIARLAVRDNVRFMMGQAPIQKFFKKLGMDVTAPGSSKIILNENGVPEAEHQAFAEFVMGLEGKNDAAYQAAIMSNDRMAFLYRQAIQRMSNGMSIKANQALKMDSSDKVEGKMMMQLMNYSYAYANLVKDAMYNKAMAAGTGSRSQITMLDRARLAVPLLVGGTLSVIAAEAGKQIIGALWPTEGTEEREKKDWWINVLDSASYAGMFGPKVEFVAKLVNRGQFPVGPSLDAGGKALAAAGGMVADSDSAQRSAKKQIYNAGVKPVVVGGASAVHPFLGFMANQAMRQESVRDAFIGEKPQ